MSDTPVMQPAAPMAPVAQPAAPVARTGKTMSETLLNEKVRQDSQCSFTLESAAESCVIVATPHTENTKGAKMQEKCHC